MKLFSVSTLRRIDLIELPKTGQIQLDPKKLRPIFETPEYIYDKVSVSLKHNLVIYTKVNTNTIYSRKIRPDPTKPNEEPKNLKITNVKSFAVDWLDENIYVISNDNNQKAIRMHPIDTPEMYYEITTATGVIRDIQVDTANGFIAWVEDEYRIMTADKQGGSSELIAEVNNLQTFDYDANSKRFFIYTSDQSGTAVYSQAYKPEGPPFFEMNVNFTNPAYKVINTIFYQSDNTRQLVFLYGDGMENSKGFDMRVELLDQNKPPSDQNATVPAVISNIRWMNYVWNLRPSAICKKSGSCFNPAYRLTDTKCRCLCNSADKMGCTPVSHIISYFSEFPSIFTFLYG